MPCWYLQRLNGGRAYLNMSTCQLRRRSQGQLTTMQRSDERPKRPKAASCTFAGNLLQRAGNFLFRGRQPWRQWSAAPYTAARLAAMVLIALILLARSYRLFVRSPVWVAIAAGSYAALAHQLGLWTFTWLVVLALLSMLAFNLARVPERNLGHRAGGKGFRGKHIENTLQALTALVQQDNDVPGGLADLAYVEFDVHETKDGELVVLHDLASVLAAAAGHAANEEVLQDLRAAGLQFDDPLGGRSKKSWMAQLRAAGRKLYGDVAGMQSITSRQLCSLEISGRAGVHVPTLEQFLRCCQNVKLQRSIAVEVKSLFSDAGRQHFVDLLREYREGHCKELEQRYPQRKYEPFGFCAAISFPFFWAASFGEFGSPSWRRWGKDLKAAGIRTRCCIFHALDLTHGVTRT